jgi:hypothetical protein
MTVAVEEILKTFDQLTDLEQLDLAIKVLQRVTNLDFPPLSDEDLVLNAESIFLDLDQQESSYE